MTSSLEAFNNFPSLVSTIMSSIMPSYVAPLAMKRFSIELGEASGVYDYLKARYPEGLKE